MLKRYAAKLLFTMTDAVLGGYTCEARIVIVRATSSRDALAQARRIGADEEWSGQNELGHTINGRFFGVMELICLELVASNDAEVWHEIFEEENPRRLIPHESQLCAVRNNE